MDTRVAAPTHAEILDAIRQAQEKEPEGAVTMLELCEAAGWHVDRGRAEVKKLMLAGKLDVVRVKRLAIDGAMRQSPGYRLKP